ncbi:hypothetical protein PCASD_08559 [Puccinia coronata f. sp. avenae]|uniref:Retrovirus-related Pol polyprotein from transposon TNT 1-94-like beta-barrel domain-containing protein n=1 Tax=Puccinia coronata f. sp. avenae TaxID=200324 RepID=A0A2N5UR55_9BASI|nr:hypothetical protein PCASD_08559 [Puccinia coronata f. sp. avenae]
MAEKIETTLKADYLPIFDDPNYTNWSGRIKVHLCGKDLWNVCTVPVNPLATDNKKEKYTKSNYEAIEIIIPRLNACCYNEVVNKDTIDTATLLWQKITNQYASNSVVDLEQIVNRIALSPDCTEDPYLVLNALQTFQTHKLNQESGSNMVAMMSTGKKFPVKVVQLCGFGEHNPKVMSHAKPQCFEKYPHLKKAQQQQRGEQKNASASYAHASASVCFRTSSAANTFVIDSAASHHMICDKSMFSSFTSEIIAIKTGSSHEKLQAMGTGTVNTLFNGKILKLVNCLYVPAIS